MKVYLAGPYQYKEAISKCAAQLREVGIGVTSSWLEEPHEPETQLHELTDAMHEMYATRDLNDIEDADIFVLFAVPADSTPIPRAGRHVEFGYALGEGMPIYVVGKEHENIFHYLSEIVHIETWEETLATLIKKSTEALGR